MVRNRYFYRDIGGYEKQVTEQADGTPDVERLLEEVLHVKILHFISL